MSFMLTVDACRNRTKTVTRRIGWHDLKPGDPVMACEKCQGLKKGQKIQRIGPIEIIKCKREPLWMPRVLGPEYWEREMALEGFPGMHIDKFISMFRNANNCGPNQRVNRIEFRWL